MPLSHEIFFGCQRDPGMVRLGLQSERLSLAAARSLYCGEGPSWQACGAA
jgi:hypothetical protein